MVMKKCNKKEYYYTRDSVELQARPVPAYILCRLPLAL